MDAETRPQHVAVRDIPLLQAARHQRHMRTHQHDRAPQERPVPRGPVPGHGGRPARPVRPGVDQRRQRHARHGVDANRREQAQHPAAEAAQLQAG